METMQRQQKPMEERRVTLRDFCSDDVQDFAEWAMDEAVTRSTSSSAHESIESVAKYSVMNFTRPSAWMGAISMDRGEGSNRCKASVGYVIGRGWWNRGITTHALEKAVALAFQQMPDVQRIEALIKPDNVGSCRVAEKCGFVNGGLHPRYAYSKGAVHDVFMYGFLRPDP